MPILLDNKLLKATEQRVEAGLTPDNRSDYMKIVVSGLRVALKDGPNSMIADLKKSRDPVHDAAVGAVNLVLLMRKQSRGTMPIKALVPASMTLMLQALDFIDKARITKIVAKKLDRATLIWRNQIFGAFHITPAVLNMAAQKAHAVMRDPTQMDIIARRTGVVKDPRASMPTALPVARAGGLINRAGGSNGV